MPLTLDSRELELLQDALALLSSPLETDDLDAWRSAVNDVVLDLFDGDQAIFLLSASAGSPFQSNEYDDATIRPYLEHFRHIDEGLRRVHERGLEVFCRRQLFEGELPELWKTKCYNDYLSPSGMEDSIGMVVPGSRAAVDCGAASEGPAPAGLWIHNHSFGRPKAGARGQEILRLLHPVFAAATATVRRLHGVGRRLGALIDTLEDAAGVIDQAGRTLHLNPPLRALLTGSPAREPLEARMEAAGRAAAGLGRPGREEEACQVRQRFTAAGRRYDVEAVALGRLLRLPTPAALVVVRRTVVRPRPRRLRARFGLTKRQAEVAVLLWEGKTNKEIAAELFISPHTARHHTERVLRKLEIHSRKDVKRVVEEDRRSSS